MSAPFSPPTIPRTSCWPRNSRARSARSSSCPRSRTSSARKQRTYDARLLQIPDVEREYSELTRDYGNAQTRYREIKAKQMQAEGAVELEKDSKAERFSLGDSDSAPRTCSVQTAPPLR